MIKNHKGLYPAAILLNHAKITMTVLFTYVVNLKWRAIIGNYSCS